MRNEHLTNVVRFGSFELDLRSGELHSGDRKVHLQEQPFQILKLLTECPGELVTREDIRRRLWPDDTVVEFDNAVNAAVKKLRIALGDSAEAPRFVETLPRRGYRFIGLIQQENGTQPAPGEPSPVVASIETAVPSAETPRQPQRRKNRLVAIALAVLAFLVAGFFYLQTAHGKPKLTDKDKIVLADFTNETGNPVFDGTLRQGLAVQLEQSPFLSLVSERRIRQMLPLMGQPANARLTPDLALQICERTASAAVLDGSIASLGSQYVLGLRAKNCRTGDILDEEQVQAARNEDVLNALTQIATKFRTRVGESLATIEKHDTPLAEATTPSLEALKLYSAARKVHASSGAMAALPLFRRATEIDPEFAMAHAWLGRMYADLDEGGLSTGSTSRAWQLRDRASDPEKFFITVAYDALVTGNLEKARQTCEAWAQTYPRDALPHAMLSGMPNKAVGRYEKAAAEARKAIELDPDIAFAYYNLAVNHAYLGRLQEAEDALRRATARGLEIDEFLMLEYDIAFLKADQAEIARVSTRARGRS